VSASQNIPFFRYPALFQEEEQDLVNIFIDVGRRGAFIMQRDLEELELNLASYVDAKHCIGVGNATDGLWMGLRAAGIGPGDEVIFSSHTMVATAAAIHFAGATPVPVECGLDHLIDPEAVASAVTLRTAAIMPTQLNGRTANMDKLQEIADQHDLAIVEDAAQALGSRFRGQAAGTFGAAGAVSFYPAKTLGCLGDGGCVFTNDDSYAEKMRLYRDHGRDSNGEVVEWCLNTRLDNLQAAILNYRLQTYDDAIARRRELAAQYESQLAEVAELVLPPSPTSHGDHFDIFQNYEIEAHNRDALQQHLKNNGVGTLVQWSGKAVHQFSQLGFSKRLPVTEKLFQRMLMLPMNTSLTNDEVAYICEQVKQFYAMAGHRGAAA